MNGSQWRPFKGVDGGALSEARRQAHYATQWLARAARAYAQPLPDDRHTNLGWDDGISGLTTHPLPQGIVLGLNISALRLGLREGPGRAGDPAIDLQGLRDADVRQWLGGHLSARGLDAAALDAPLPYRIHAHAIASGAPYGAVGLGAALAELVTWYANAHRVLEERRARIIDRGIEAPPVRCWPHHFDLDSLLALGSGTGAHTVGVGFCPGDEYYRQPYFYVTRHPPPDVAALPPLPPIGHWHSHHFTAAVALADRILAAQDQAAETAAFLDAAIAILTAGF
jgi:hypothetical protein